MTARDWADDVADALGGLTTDDERRAFPERLRYTLDYEPDFTVRDMRAAYDAGYSAGRRAPIDWAERSAEECLRALREAPKVADVWCRVDDVPEPNYERRHALGWIAASAFWNDGRWVWGAHGVGPGSCGTAADLPSAQSAADAALVAAGWRLCSG